PAHDVRFNPGPLADLKRTVPVGEQCDDLLVSRAELGGKGIDLALNVIEFCPTVRCQGSEGSPGPAFGHGNGSVPEAARPVNGEKSQFKGFPPNPFGITVPSITHGASG